MSKVVQTLMLLAGLAVTTAQQVGDYNPEVHVPMNMKECTKAGCSPVEAELTLDTNWRWLHKVGSIKNCFLGNEWVKKFCSDPKVCTSECALDGIDTATYQSVYGVVAQENNGLSLTYVNPKGSVGSRLYAMDSPDTYKVFKLLNREIAFDVDVSQLGCGLNGAVYFVEMPASGGKGDGGNMAGAMYGTGYCDAQCPKDTKFPGGLANIEGWSSKRPRGNTGSCCAEMDIFEANNQGSAFTVHPCGFSGQELCQGQECGDQVSRSVGKCDLDGCDFNSWRLGNKTFYGCGDEFTLNSCKVFTVVTQFFTHDGTDTGDLSEIRRFYVQNGKVINNPAVTDVPKASGGRFDSVTDEFCSAQKSAFQDPNGFGQMGGLKQMGEAMKRGMVMVLSLWDDSLTDMRWLDAEKSNLTMPKNHPGNPRGPCKADAGKPSDLRKNSPTSTVTYANIRYGALGTTTSAGLNAESDGGTPQIMAKFDDAPLEQRDFAVKPKPTFLPGLLSPVANILTLTGGVLVVFMLVYRVRQLAVGRPAARRVFVRTEKCDYDVVKDARTPAMA